MPTPDCKWEPRDLRKTPIDGIFSYLFWSSLLLTTKHARHTTHSTKELRKQIFSTHPAHIATSSGEAFFTILIVDLTLLGIGQDLVCVRNLCKTNHIISPDHPFPSPGQLNGGDKNIPLNLSAASGLGFLSGWNFRAETLYAFLSLFSSASGVTCEISPNDR